MATNTGSTKSTCYGCGQRILGWPYPLKGHNYCYECFQTAQQEVEKEEQEKEILYHTIRRIFKVSEIPSEVLNAIERELKSGRKIRGLESTIKYYYDIMENPVGPITNLGFILHDQYDNAKNYVARISAIMRHNDTVDLNVPPVTVKVTRDSLRPIRNDDISYKIEDLK